MKLLQISELNCSHSPNAITLEGTKIHTDTLRYVLQFGGCDVNDVLLKCPCTRMQTLTLILCYTILFVSTRPVTQRDFNMGAFSLVGLTLFLYLSPLSHSLSLRLIASPYLQIFSLTSLLFPSILRQVSALHHSFCIFSGPCVLPFSFFYGAILLACKLQHIWLYKAILLPGFRLAHFVKRIPNVQGKSLNHKFHI